MSRLPTTPDALRFAAQLVMLREHAKAIADAEGLPHFEMPFRQLELIRRMRRISQLAGEMHPRDLAAGLLMFLEHVELEEPEPQMMASAEVVPS